MLAYLTQKVHFMVKIDSFLAFMLIHFLVRTLQKSNFVFFFAHETMKNPPPHLQYFNKIAEIFSTAMRSQSALKQKGNRLI